MGSWSAEAAERRSTRYTSRSRMVVCVGGWVFGVVWWGLGHRSFDSVGLGGIGLDQSVPRDRSTLNPINRSIDRTN